MDEMTVDELWEHIGNMGRGNKYNAKKTTVDGITFDSKVEARRYQELKLLEAAGEISDLVYHPIFVLLDGFTDKRGEYHRAITYEADFTYLQGKKTVAEDVKGMSTDVFKIKRKLFIFRYPDIELRIVRM